MTTNQDILDQQEILETYRRTLAVYLRQQAAAGNAQASPMTINGIREARENIRRIKEVLQSWGVAATDHPDDEETSASIAAENVSNGLQSRSDSSFITTGNGSINVGVGNLPNSNIHVGNIYDSSVFPYEFIEVRFFARTNIYKVETEVKKLFVFKGKDMRWPLTIEYDVIASISGSFDDEHVLMKGVSEYVEYDYRESYDNPLGKFKAVSVEDLANGRIGWHHYYPIDLKPAQKHIVQFVNSLGQQRWELITPPQSLGKLNGTLDVEVSPPHRNTWRFSGGEVRFYVGQSKSNPEGIVYSLKRSKTK